MKTLKLLCLTLFLGLSGSSFGEGLKSVDLNNTSLGSGSAGLSMEQLKEANGLPLQGSSATSAGGQQISPEQMAEMLKVLEEYKAKLGERNKALQDLLNEE